MPFVSFMAGASRRRSPWPGRARAGRQGLGLALIMVALLSACASETPPPVGAPVEPTATPTVRATVSSVVIESTLPPLPTRPPITPTRTPTPRPTVTPTPTLPPPPTATPVPPTVTPVPPTATPVPPTATSAPPTSTRVPPTPTATPSAKLAPSPGCEIKGIVQANGDKVYYRPGWQGYERLVVDVKAGGRWFCSENDARANGFRAPRQ